MTRQVFKPVKQPRIRLIYCRGTSHRTTAESDSIIGIRPRRRKPTLHSLRNLVA